MNLTKLKLKHGKSQWTIQKTTKCTELLLEVKKYQS